ncbi:MAG: ATP-grasp domain-containing protein, partial [Sneathiellales bacterium]|nr:ATP-grasp domain-containing protein [Sneathiellales bacterium]
MSIKRLLIANRGEIALRVAQTARRLNIKTIGLYPEDDASSLHVRKLDEALKIPGAGPAAYLDINAVIEAAKEAGADAVHPGYGFLSENTEFARACEKAGLIFVGPESETLQKLADKSAARALALECGVSVLAGTNAATSLEEAIAFFDELKSGSQMFIKAISGGGGRGMRLVTKKVEIEDAFSAAALEAKSAFGDDRLYVEQFMPQARHIEVQVLGDGKNVQHFFERDCSLQRRNQKILEIAPAPFLDPKLRQALCDAAVKMAKKIRYKGLGTFEFLVSVNEDQFAFMEANPRIQVEHTITEEILDLDLVSLQLKVAMGSPLEELGLKGSLPAPTGYAIQARVNAEIIQSDGK